MSARILRLASVAALATAVVMATGCGGPLARLAKQGEWAELDARARDMKRIPQGKGARAWAQALVELGQIDEARAVLLRDFRTGGRDASLVALAQLEADLGLRGLAAAHYARAIAIDLDVLDGKDAPGAAAEACALLGERARVLARIGEPLAADADMRRVAALCPASLTKDDRAFMTELRPQAQAQANAQRSLGQGKGEEGGDAPNLDALEARLGDALKAARKRSPRALVTVAEVEDMSVTPDDVAGLLAAEFGGALGPGLVSDQRLSSWIGDAPMDALLEAVDALPDGVREYALLRISAVRSDPNFDGAKQRWVVAAQSALDGQGPLEAARGWRIGAVIGELGGAEFVLNTNLRDTIPPEPTPEGEQDAAPKPLGMGTPWALRVPVDRRSFELLLTVARLLELRDKAPLALELRRRVIVEGSAAGLVQVSAVAVDEVRRQLALGRPWQALAIAEVVPGPLVDEVLPAAASALALANAAGVSVEDDRKVVWRVLGDPWFAGWEPRLDTAMAGLELSAHAVCPAWSAWRAKEPAQTAALGAVGLDPAASQAALEAVLVGPNAGGGVDTPEGGRALRETIERDLGLSCSAPLVGALAGGLHALQIEALDEALVQAPELEGARQKQLHAELALAHGAGDRARQLTQDAAAITGTPERVWARAVVAGRSFADQSGAREYTLAALRELQAHTRAVAGAAGDGPTRALPSSDAVGRELLLMRLRDVDVDGQLRGEDEGGLIELRAAVADYLAGAPSQRQWQRLDALLWAVAKERRADERAWELLADALLDAETRARHPHAVAAFERARQGDGASATAPGGKSAASSQRLLSDLDAVCADVEADGEGSEAERAARWIGIATVCSPRARAEALAALVAALDGAEPGEDGLDRARAVRERVLAGPVAVELAPGQRGVLRSVPAISTGLDGGGDGFQPSAELSLRVVAGLPLAPVWAVGE
ncbi:hypothetical protein PPSIR1_16055 [Plesiocystis pacifica SIR-1]|uniref:Uncharacterized protein n=1 Tax=Plesiocystis pacifica SIR-1 TaxID=391625 RepID=A6GAT9_9BACT|nr:hypothetical protein [Plesiocystis pacifica]EDM77030.1 hypothetical protein PPSIR1_16055 [Plesiocystis pacifica SIR-1]